MSLRIRPAVEADLPALADLEAASFPEPWSRDLLASDLRHPAALVLVAAEAGNGANEEAHGEAGGLVGYAGFRHAGGEAELLRIAVAPRVRSRGVGGRLVAAGLDELAARRITRCFLEVRPANASARALYARFGFEQVGRRRAYFADGSDALVLALSLPGARPR